MCGIKFCCIGSKAYCITSGKIPTEFWLTFAEQFRFKGGINSTATFQERSALGSVTGDNVI